MSDKTEEEYRILLTALNRVVTDKTMAATTDRETLRDAVCAYVAAEQARGTSLRSIIQIVKEILRKAEEAANSATEAVDLRNSELAQALVDWCEEFHRVDGVASA